MDSLVGRSLAASIRLLATWYLSMVGSGGGPHSLDRRAGIVSEIFCGRIPGERGAEDKEETSQQCVGVHGEGSPSGIEEDKTLTELAEQFDVHPNPANQIQEWKNRLVANAPMPNRYLRTAHRTGRIQRRRLRIMRPNKVISLRFILSFNVISEIPFDYFCTI